jgi:CDP-paratose 2-epimerase
MAETILVTGGAGFVGSTLALSFKAARNRTRVMALDNLKRRGSETSLDRFRSGGVEFVHGDIRCPEDLDGLNPADWIIDCSAEASVQAGYGGDVRYLVRTNLDGTLNCLDLAKKWGAGVIFLSTSRVYPIDALRSLPLMPQKDRLVLPEDAEGPGWSAVGVRSDFPLAGHRSIYGATKLASELMIQEYRALFDLKAVINRCGVLTGPWQFGRTEQGFVSLWAARHLFGGRLEYQGFGGKGRQVRDILHVDDLFRLIDIEMNRIDEMDGCLFNVGGGSACSLSLRELSQYCREKTGREVPIGSRTETHPADIPYYITDNGQVSAQTGWQPRYRPDGILDSILAWLTEQKERVRPLF